ncbi:MAG: ATP-binding cassette domain-containing protein, partial [Spirochaetaceae bacterium]|nr:ATP-binding cassette domain-containing protein [Spirochaetaceae bacterium]
DSGLETLELALTGFLRPSGGRVVLSGRDLTGKDPRAFREAGMAYLSAGGAVAPRLPMGESIILHAHRRSRKGFWGRLGIMDRRFLDSWIVRIMNASGVSFSPKAWGSSFSGGMIQRVALARELAENTPFLVLSEPGWGLDRKSREGLARILRAAAQAGRGILIFSTDIDELVVLSDEILVLRNGMVSALVSLETLKGSSPQETAILAVKESIGGAMVGIPERTHV